MNMAEPMKRESRRLTERADLITGSRWCMSCSMYRRADNGSWKVVSGGMGRTRRQWTCAVCTSRMNGRER